MSYKEDSKYLVFGRKHKCKACGKEWWVDYPDLYVYKIKYGARMFWYCSYHCFRIGEKTDYKPRQRQVRKPTAYKPPEYWYEVRAMRDNGASHKEIAERFGIHTKSVGSIISRLNRFEQDGGKERPYDYR